MWDMMLGPMGQTYWNGPAVMPKAALHHDWSRVAFAAAATTQPLDAFSYAIGTQQPAAITAAIGATQANTHDTSITKPDALSRDCIATHLGVFVENMCLCAPGVGADVALTGAAMAMVYTRLMIRVFYAERSNEEFSGKVADLPAGKGFDFNMPVDAANAFWGQLNGHNSFQNIRPLPQPLPCQGGVTYFRVTFEPTRKAFFGGAPGITCGAITGLRADVYGICPPRQPPVEATRGALQALNSLR